MRKFVILSVTCIASYMSFTSISQAKSINCEIPKNCNVIGSHINLGKGNGIMNYIEILCKFPNGDIVQYLDSQMDFWGILGLNRVIIPQKIYFNEGKNNEFSCK